MHSANCWMMGLSFVLGLLLTFAFTIRRVKREVPVSAALGGGASAPTAPIPAPGTATVPGGTAPSEAETTKMAVGGAPYGEGSARAGAGGSGPAGWTIKGNEDSMLYHTTDSPWYGQTIAEVWFREEKAAEAAGFTRWDKGKAATGLSGAATVAAEVEEVPPGPYGLGSTKAGPGGSGPAGWTIKGNEDSMLYHGPDSPSYDVTIAEVWFVDEKTAAAAGFNRWDSGRKRKKKK
ncbi:channel accessory protein ArfC, sunset domain variant [[Mycobacterium] nativiensis]|uniref:Uncharacterized protein n=1 Tax=[Mycobacterium] nativiensis TaxID=2855503 RepID=A0ABU5Y3A2_9MYCO|nr:hypothetical protein [Mycolicibacter sp. MYC340]MEB3034690.1 hypothetical protein [Mycolicibacter sp. MYC340]